MNNEEKSELIAQSADIALSAAGSLVGLVIGGPVGAIAGGVLSPTTKLAVTAGQLWLRRRKERLIKIVDRAFHRSGVSEDAIYQEMIDSPEWCDTLISMIRHLSESDPELDLLFSEIMACSIRSEDETDRNRYIVLYDSIKGINKVQLHILKNMHVAGGKLAAKSIAEQVKVPELELRNAVRDLELRGMIVDNGSEPTIWTLRELGIAVANTICTVETVEGTK